MSTQNTTKKVVTPKLTCNITGSSRVTNRKYLQAKADKKNVDVETFLAHYVCKDALRQLKAGRSVEEIRSDYPEAPSGSTYNEGWVERTMKINGKNGPSGPHAKSTPPAEPTKKLSPEVEKLVAAVREQEEVLANA